MFSQTFSLRYGKTTWPIAIPEANLLDVLVPHEVLSLGARSAAEIVAEALASPIGSLSLAQLAEGKKNCCILVSDITRPVPTALLLPPLLAELKRAGLTDDRITIVLGLGIHRRHTPAETEHLVGSEVYRRIRCLDHDPDDCVSLGHTRGGLPVEIFRPVVEADLRICTGNIDLHYIVGYTGGAKAIMPGVSSRASIEATHCQMLDPRARAGRLEGNPARAAIDEVGAIVGLDFLLNVVVDENKQVLAAFAGDGIRAHRAGCAFVDRLFKVEIGTKADIAVVSAGGFPKDLNLYQAQKALDNAGYAVREGGRIILVAECHEGLGEDTFAEWVMAARRPEDLLERINRHFVLGGHKAAALAMLLQHAKVTLVSGLDEEMTARLFFDYAPDPQTALADALAEYGSDATVRVIPFGGNVLPHHTG